MNNDTDTCQQMVSIAELASNQHNDRRQLTFRIAIGYTTLLALGIYLTTKTPSQGIVPTEFNMPWVFSGLLAFVTFVYCRVLWILHVASNNDVRRRDFYLKKAECIVHHMSQNEDSHFIPDSSDKYIIINLGASENKDPVTERELFDEKGPDIFIPSMKRGTSMPKIDFHYLSLIAIPIFLTILLVLNWLIVC